MAAAPTQTPIVLGLEHNGICMTTDEFDAITEYDDLYKFQLIHGVVCFRDSSWQSPVYSPLQIGGSRTGRLRCWIRIQTAGHLL